MKAKDLKPSETDWMLWGAAGSGKTAFLGQLGSKLQIVDLDGKSIVLRNFQDKYTPQRQEVDVVLGLYEDIKGQSFGWLRLKEYILKVAEQSRKGEYPFKVFCIDSATRMFEECMRYVRAMFKGTEKIEHDLTPTRSHHYYAQNEFMSMIQICCNLPGVIFALTCHEETTLLDNVASREPLLPGQKLAPLLRTFFSEIWYCKKVMIGDKEEFVVQTVKSSGATASTCLQVPNETPMSKGLIEILKERGVEL